MFKKLLFLICFALPALAAVNERDGFVLDSGGRPVSGAIVRVCTGGTATTVAACTSFVTIYQDYLQTRLVNQSTNPLQTDFNGNYQFFTAANPVDVQIQARGHYQVISNITLFPSGGAITSISTTAPMHTTGGATPTISLQNSGGSDITASLGTDTKFYTASGSAAANGNIIVGDAQGGITDSGTALSTIAPSGTQGYMYTYGISAVPTPVSPRYLYAKDYGVVADGTNQCGSHLTALVTACNAGGTVLFDPGTTLLSTCNLNLNSSLALNQNCILEGRGAATGNGTLATPPSTLKMTYSNGGTDKFHIDCLRTSSGGGRCGARNLTILDDTTNLTFMLFTTVPELNDVTLWGKYSQAAGQVPVNDGIYFGNFDGSDNPYTNCVQNSEASATCEYGNSAQTHVNVTFNNIKRGARFGGGASGIGGFFYGNFSDAYINDNMGGGGHHVPQGPMVEFKAPSGNPAYSNNIEVHTEMADFSTHLCNYTGTMELHSYALNNKLISEGSDLGVPTTGSCNWSFVVDDTTSTNNNIDIMYGQGNLGTINDPSTAEFNTINDYVLKKFSVNTIQTTTIGLTGGQFTGVTFVNMQAYGVYGFNGFGGTSYAKDTGISRDSAGVIDIGNGTAGDTSGRLQAAAYIKTGTAATLTGTGTCATRSNQAGGATAGQIKCTGTSGPATLTITTGITAPNEWNCRVTDITAGLNGVTSTLSPTAPVVSFGSGVSTNDILSFDCTAY